MRTREKTATSESRAWHPRLGTKVAALAAPGGNTVNRLKNRAVGYADDGALWSRYRSAAGKRTLSQRQHVFVLQLPKHKEGAIGLNPGIASQVSVSEIGELLHVPYFHREEIIDIACELGALNDLRATVYPSFERGVATLFHLFQGSAAESVACQ